MKFEDAFKGLIDSIQSNYMSYFVALAGLGVLTMALIQALKNLLPIRMLYHRWALTRWLKRKSPGQAATIQTRILALAADGNAMALYDAETEEFCRNLESVAQLAVDHPTCYQDVLLAMTSSPMHADVGTLSDLTKDRQTRLDARDRIRQHIAQSVNAFRLSTASKWMNGMHVASFVVSSSLANYALWLGNRDAGLGPVVGMSLLAAFLAPVARDLVEALARLKSK